MYADAGEYYWDSSRSTGDEGDDGVGRGDCGGVRGRNLERVWGVEGDQSEGSDAVSSGRGSGTVGEDVHEVEEGCVDVEGMVSVA